MSSKDGEVDGSHKEKIVTRAYTSYQPRWQRFVVKQPTLVTTDPPYNRQYSHLYTSRLMELRPRCQSAASDIVVPRIIELRENEFCTVVGTFIKESNNRPSSTTSTYDGSAISIEPPLQTFCSEKDVLVLEDESGRVELVLTEQATDNTGRSISIHDLSSGVVAAVSGVIPSDSGGVMNVSSISFPSYANLTLPSQPSITYSQPAPYVLLVSGLKCNTEESKNGSHSLCTDLLVDYISGNIPALQEQAARVARVILAGGNCGSATSLATTSKGGFSEKSSKKRIAEAATLPIQELDLFLSKILRTVPVDVLPGKYDPTNANWPQQPLHSCLLPSSSSSSMVCRTTNPYEAILGGKLVIGTDGSNIQDLRQYIMLSHSATMPTELQTLEQTLVFGHLAPTAPDSLHSFPFASQDPYILSDMPNIYFAGNCAEFASKVATLEQQSCRLICIPDFSVTHEVVLVNLETLETECIKIIDVDDHQAGAPPTNHATDERMDTTS